MKYWFHQIYANLSVLRWLLLIVFPLVCIPAILANFDLEPLLYACLATLSCVLIFRCLSEIKPENFSVWLVIGFFIGIYFLRYAYFVLDPTPVRGIQPSHIFQILNDDPSSLFTAYKFSALAFAVFCCFSSMLLKIVPAAKLTINYEGVYVNSYVNLSKCLLVLISVLMITLGFLANRYHIGQMGVPAGEPLPFRLKGLIFYGRLVLLPLLILTLIYLGNRADRLWQVQAGLILLSLHGLSDMILRGSRSTLLLCIILVIFLVINRGLRLRIPGLGICIFLGVVAICLMPIIMHYRISRFSSQEGAVTLFLSAFDNYTIGLQTFSIGISGLYFRLPGLETLWAILSLKAEPLGQSFGHVLGVANGVTGYLNVDLYQLSSEFPTLYAPGFLGWWYLVWGVKGIVLGMFMLAVVTIFLPRLILFCGLKCAPVANTFFLWILFVSLSDGTLDSNLLLLCFGMFCLGLIELGLRFDRQWFFRSRY